MDDDKTIIKPQGPVGGAADANGGLPLPSDILSVRSLDADGRIISTFSLSHSFTAGRAADNTIVIDNDGVSRHHVEIRGENGRWRIRNLSSANGTYIDDRLIEHEEELIFPARVSLGNSGAWLEMTTGAQVQVVAEADVAESAAITPNAGGLDDQIERPPRRLSEKRMASLPETQPVAHDTDPRGIRGDRRPLPRAVAPDSGVLSGTEPLGVAVLDADGQQTATFVLVEDFRVGRASDNTIVINNGGVSRHHLAVRKDDGRWRICNLGSANGVYIDDRLIEHEAELSLPARVSLGPSGIWLQITRIPQEKAVATPVAQSGPALQQRRNLAPEDIKARLLAENEAEDSGDYTRIVRRIIHEDRVIRKRSYKKVIWVLGILFSLSLSMAAYQQIALANTRQLALEMFYDIKTLEVSLSQADIKLEESADTLDKAMAAITNERLRVVDDQLKAEREKITAERKRMLQEREKLAAMKGKYRQYVEEANSLRLRFPTAKRYEEELIARVASELGESELELPDDFVAEVRKYIQYWQGSARMQKAMDNIEKNNYLPVVTGALKKHGLPLYFIYLPLQESNYDTQAIGPQTRFGIAKGAWQLLATTAQEYGVPAGPLADVAAYDAQDARFDFAQATQAGVKYLKRIYSSEAQASGLLVMASYNYGDTRVRKMIREMPDNPRERNFWKFARQYQLPKETHDYVFYILSAAVIGEDPRHFGFKFNPPLLMAEAGSKAESSTGRQKQMPP
ncbi:MAG: Membrane-bound lytic murein transglycosylase D precursor [Candidatus Accumulibacter sp. SK-11]|nr:MAG: Membrane-bound lytic murein transglycosylase D precursor [Candidatus Accumulibacter sp. SK-11]